MLPMLGGRLIGVAPFETMRDVQRELGELLGTVRGGAPAESAAWSVPTDVVESGHEIRCTLEVPGLEREEIEVLVENHLLTVSGEKKSERAEDEDGKGIRHRERRYGRFERRFVLPRSVDARRVSASYENGVITIVLPKSEESKPRRVEIRSGDWAQQVGAGEN